MTSRVYVGLVLIVLGCIYTVWTLRTDRIMHAVLQGIFVAELGVIYLVMAIVPKPGGTVAGAMLAVGALFTLLWQIKLSRRWRRESDIRRA